MIWLLLLVFRHLNPGSFKSLSKIALLNSLKFIGSRRTIESLLTVSSVQMCIRDSYSIVTIQIINSDRKKRSEVNMS